MSEWTESTLRQAAAWQAFKEGKGLWENGMVGETQAGSTGWTGSVRAGKRPLNVRVTVKSPTDVEVRCACPDNQRTGAVCAHAVATGLAVLARRSAAAAPPPAAVRPTMAGAPAKTPAAAAPAPVAARAWTIALPENWRESFRRGTLVPSLRSAVGEPPAPADERLTPWLAAMLGRLGEKPLHLRLAGPELAAFLERAEGHPRVAAAGRADALEITGGEVIALAELERRDGRVRLVPREPCQAVRLGGEWWTADPGGLRRVGSGEPPEAAVVAELLAGRPAALEIGPFLKRAGDWQGWLGLPPDCWLERLRFVPAPAVFSLALDGSLALLRARLEVRYGDAPPATPGEGDVAGLPRVSDDRAEVRDEAAEMRARWQLGRAGFEPAAAGEWLLRGEDAVISFITGQLPTIRREWSVSESPAFQRARQSVLSVEPKIAILGAGDDWLDFELSFQTSDGNVIPAAEVRALLRSGRSAKGRRIVVSSEVEELIDPLFSELDVRQESGRFKAGPAAGELIRELRKKLDKSQTDDGLPGTPSVAVPATVVATLRPYQLAGLGWLHDRLERFGGALLADDMGLGKTIQTIALIELLFQSQDRPILVVVTASLLGNWRAEVGRFAPARRVRTLHGGGRDAERERVGPGDIVLTSYGTLARDLAWHLRQRYGAVVLDEASLMRNPDTDHAKAIYKLETPRRVALTGTPVENGVRDLWSVFRFLQPGWLGGREEFRERYEQPLAAGDPPARLLERLRLKTGPFMLRRTKEQVAPELPSKLFVDELCDLSDEQWRVYREVMAEGRKLVESSRDAGQAGAARMRMLTALLRLRQTCCDLSLLGNERLSALALPRRSAKLQRLLELLEEALAGGHRVLVFSQFRSQLDEIGKQLDARGWGYLQLDGRTRKRQERVDHFQRADGPPVFLISLKAGGYGLNLTAADTVVHFDPWWNPAAEAQATDRAHRIGQTRPVTVYRLISRGTVEEKVLALQARKRALASAIDEAGAADAPNWSEAELVRLLEDA